ncbi:O-antigen ligase family protein [Providencia rettgeri]|uniref:O-antigen ligase family protein n=2 Tax=Providencia rettgeri TaxID=587 RepID=UPI0013E0C103|nr:O-antigen ligase family protein [Providencia rettgeri]
MLNYKTKKKSVVAITIGFCLPFVASNLPYWLNPIPQLQLFDIARIYITALLLVYIFLKPTAFLKININRLFVYLVLLTALNTLALLIGVFYNDKINLLSLFNFPLSFIYYVMLPIVFLKIYFIGVDPEQQLNLAKLIFKIANSVVFFVCILQINSLFNLFEPLSYIYNNFLFYFLEGRWGGWVHFTSINSNSDNIYILNTMSSPIVTNIHRLSGTFQEPSLLAMYISLMFFPILFSKIESSTIRSNFKKSNIIYLLSPLILILSFSSTGYLILFINISILISSLLFKKNKIYIFIFLFFLLIVSTVIGPWFIEKLFLLEKLFSITDDSSATRYGSIYSSIMLFFDNLLGVGYGMHPSLLPNYIPEWALTIENTKDRIALHSLLMRVIVDFGAIGMILVMYFFYICYSKYRSNKNLKSKSYLKYYLINFLILCISDLPFNEIWLLFSLYFSFYILPKSKSDFT